MSKYLIWFFMVLYMIFHITWCVNDKPLDPYNMKPTELMKYERMIWQTGITSIYFSHERRKNENEQSK